MKSACKTVFWLLCNLLVWDVDFRPPAAPSPGCWELRPGGETFFTPRTRRFTASSPVLCPLPPHLCDVLPPRCFQPQRPAGCFVRFHLHEASLMPDCPCFVWFCLFIPDRHLFRSTVHPNLFGLEPLLVHCGLASSDCCLHRSW